MDSSATTVLLTGFGPGCTVNLFVTGGFATSTTPPPVSGDSENLVLLGVG